MTPRRSSAANRGQAGVLGDEERLEALCARPGCRKAFARGTGAGRNKIYCDDDCRHAARTELRRLRRRLEHWQNNVAQARADIAAYRGDEDAHAVGDDDLQRTAEVAAARARAVLDFVGPGDERLLGELRALYEAIAPLVARGEDVASVA